MWPILLFPLLALAVNPHPKAPAGWVELHSLNPVILTWAEATPEKKLEQTNHFMVQRYERTPKLVSFIEEQKNENNCRVVPARKSTDYSQLWCLRKDTVLVLLSHGDPTILKAPQEVLTKWIVSHE